MPVPGQVANPELLHTRDVSYQSGGDVMAAYLARPRAPGTYPGIIVIHEVVGLVEHIRDVTRRLANVGYIALAPSLYIRVGNPDPRDMPSVFLKAGSLSDSQLLRDLEAAAVYLRAQEGASGKVGCIGFSFGGRLALLLASSSDKVDGAVDCWGGFITRANPTQVTTPQRPTPVIDLVDQLHCPLLAVFGAEDQSPSPTDAAELRSRLEKTGKTATVKIFENAGHAFFADYRPEQYREGPAFELWPQVVSFFETHLK